MCLNGRERCAWASPTSRHGPDRCLCPAWPSPTSPTAPSTGPHPWTSPSVTQALWWSSGSPLRANCTAQPTASATSCCQEWTSASRFGPWLTSTGRRAPSSSWVSGTRLELVWWRAGFSCSWFTKLCTCSINANKPLTGFWNGSPLQVLRKRIGPIIKPPALHLKRSPSLTPAPALSSQAWVRMVTTAWTWKSPQVWSTSPAQILWSLQMWKQQVTDLFLLCSQAAAAWCAWCENQPPHCLAATGVYVITAPPKSWSALAPARSVDKRSNLSLELVEQ